jgi:hypothetical protein
MTRRCSICFAHLLFGIALVACGSDDIAKPGDALTLTFTGKSRSDYFFALENPTAKAVYFRGYKSFWSATTTPLDISFDCKSDKTGEGTVGGFPLFDGGKDPATIALLPGKAVKLKVKSSAGFKLGQHEGEACKVHLGLWQPDTSQHSRENVNSREFQA